MRTMGVLFFTNPDSEIDKIFCRELKYSLPLDATASGVFGSQFLYSFEIDRVHADLENDIRVLRFSPLGTIEIIQQLRAYLSTAPYRATEWYPLDRARASAISAVRAAIATWRAKEAMEQRAQAA